jgi:hypothetical protein
MLTAPHAVLAATNKASLSACTAGVLPGVCLLHAVKEDEDPRTADATPTGRMVLVVQDRPQVLAPEPPCRFPFPLCC